MGQGLQLSGRALTYLACAGPWFYLMHSQKQKMEPVQSLLQHEDRAGTHCEPEIKPPLDTSPPGCQASKPQDL